MIKYLTGVPKLLRLIGANFYRGFWWPTIKYVKREQEVCYILGNGPSLSLDLAKKCNILQKNAVFGVNFFGISDEYIQIKPKYYVLADPAFWEKNLNEQLEKKVDLLFRLLEESTSWEVNLIVPYLGAAKLKRRFIDSRYIKVYYFNNMTLETDTPIDHFVYSRFLGAPLIQNVLVSAIFNAILIGFKEINLLGADHSWIHEIRINGDNEVCIEDKHFYDNSSLVKLSPWKKRDGSNYKMHEILVDLAKMFKGYHKLREIAKRNGVEIYNCSKGSYIDAFERKTL
jgi:hypothetical protein